MTAIHHLLVMRSYCRRGRSRRSPRSCAGARSRASTVNRGRRFAAPLCAEPARRGASVSGAACTLRETRHALARTLATPAGSRRSPQHRGLAPHRVRSRPGPGPSGPERRFDRPASGGTESASKSTRPAPSACRVRALGVRRSASSPVANSIIPTSPRSSPANLGTTRTSKRSKRTTPTHERAVIRTPLRNSSTRMRPSSPAGRIPDFPVTRSHPPASWPSAANSSICRTYRKTAGEESRRRSPIANRWMRP